MRVPIDNLGSAGLIKDLFSHDLPPEAWTHLQNARMGPHGAEKFTGHEKTLGTNSSGWTVAPYWLFHVPVAGGVGKWVGAGANKVYTRHASTFTETNITRQSVGVDVNYSATETKKWNGGVFGGILVITNGVDQPQFWADPSTPGKLANLSTATGSDPWDATHVCAVIRPFGRYLVALDITKNGTRYPQLVKWSHPAEAGAMPTSWDTADPAVDAGEYPLQDASGYLVDQCVLRNKNMLYTTDQVWEMRHTGDGYIFGFEPVLREQGALTTGCATRFKKGGMQHVVMGGDDIFVHNGSDADSVISPYLRRWFFQQIDPTNYARCFVVPNPAYEEVWFCIPEIGAEQPTLALIWNWRTGAVGFRDLLKESSTDTRTTAGTKGTPCIAIGTLEATSTEAWSGDSAAWSADVSVWDARSTSPVVPRLLMADRSTGKRTFLLDYSQTFDESDITYIFERTGLAIGGQDRQGNPRVDTEMLKQLTEIWPRFDAPEGTTIQVDVGVQNDVDEPVEWQGSYTYTVGTDPFVACFHVGRYLSVRFSDTNDVSTRLLGYALEISDAGRYH